MVSDIKKDIEVAKYIIKNTRFMLNSDTYASPFSNTNENIDIYFEYFPIRNNNVLTVCGSGDHVLESIKEGAKVVDTFDLNPLAMDLAKLKISAVKVLDYMDFVNYFYNKPYDRETYKKIRDYLDSDIRLFWDSLYESNIDTNYDELIRYSDPKYNSGLNSFRLRDNYYYMKDKLEDATINYYLTDIFSIPNIVKNKYDVMFLSNIYDWLPNHISSEEFSCFIKCILSELLNDKGMIAVYTSNMGHYRNDLDKYFNDLLELDDDVNTKVLIYKK